MNSSALPLLAVLAGALAGAGLFVFIAAIRGLPPKAKTQGPSALERAVKDMFSIRGAIAVIVEEATSVQEATTSFLVVLFVR